MSKHLSQTISLAGLIFFYSTATLGSSAEVIGRAPDNTGGRLMGASSAFLVGGALGGPLGAIAGAALGSWVGGRAQQATELSGDTYVVRTAEGKTQSFRSPQHQFAIGDLVTIDGIRLRPIHDAI